ncbi:MAG TPA: hypothetical protein VJM12_21740 [Pyrinomonadaceae bacterium]|nr:hypothetical protein [Pyrinomonadaceae bacterium]
MLKRFLAIVLSGLIFQLVIAAPAVYAQSGNGDQLAAKARAEVSKLGTGKQVEVNLRDNSKFKGHIIETAEDSFTVADSKSATARTVAYADVAQVKKASNGGSWKPWAIIGGIAAGAVVTWIVVKPALCDGGAQTRGPC